MKSRTHHGLPPLLRELAEEFGITPVTAYGHLQNLDRFGLLKGERRARRGRRVTPAGHRILKRDPLGLMRQAWQLLDDGDRNRFLEEVSCRT